ncbi:alpha-L-fucosidase [Cyclobacterium roseum]|uniref:alpha-L-fucosidase n=1 Tax=Cyclobacterium roseum TaxID=2666137 RepID=UPI001390F3C2|nr:alpha-L-fucosidase [Cyclobacterium roseum]
MGKKMISTILLLSIFTLSAIAQNRASWMKDAQWGVMIHYQPEWLASENQLDSITLDNWNELIDNYDCDGLAKQLSEVGAGYLIFTVRHGPAFFASPNSMYDHYTGQVPSRCSNRDLISDLSDALDEYGIKLIAYLPAHAPYRNKAEMEGFALTRGDHYKFGAFERNSEALLRWQEIIREYSIRWGDKVAGWWLDGCYRPNINLRQPDIPNFASLAAAARSGNPNRIVAFNPGVFPRIMSLTPYEDYTAGETNDPGSIQWRYNYEGMIDGKQIQILSYLGKFWGQGAPRFAVDEVVKYSTDIKEVGGAVTWDVPPSVDGTIPSDFMKQLTKIGEALGTNK